MLSGTAKQADHLAGSLSMWTSLIRRSVIIFCSVLTSLVFGTSAIFAEDVPAKPLATGATAAPVSSPLVGFWFVAAKDSVIELSTCTGSADGSPGTICGRIAWIRDPLDASGKLRRDTKNPDRTLRNNLLCGTAVLWGLTADDKRAGRWRDGKAYIATRGLRVNPRVDLAGPDSIRVRGSIGPFEQTEIWTRADPAGPWKC